MSLIFMAVSVQAEEPMSPLMEKLYDGNWPSDEEANKLVDELFYQRAVHAYMTMLPALNVIGMRDGSEAELHPHLIFDVLDALNMKLLNDDLESQCFPSRSAIMTARYGIRST